MNNLSAIQPSREEIAACAYLIWEKEGRPSRRDVAHWLQAEKQLKADRALDAGLAPRSVLHRQADVPRPTRHHKAQRREATAS